MAGEVEVFESRAAAQMNSVAVRVGRGAILVDPGILPDELARIDAWLAAEGRTVDLVVLTHCHWDHVAGAGRFGAPGAAHPAFPAWLRAVEAEEPAQEGLQRAYDREGLGRAPPVRVPPASVLLADGEALYDLRALHLPGHTGDGVGLVGRGVLVCGDILDSLELPLPLHDVDVYLASLARIAALLDDVGGVVPGHGPPLSRGQARARLEEEHRYLTTLRVVAGLAVERGFGPDWPAFQVMDWPGKGHPDRDAEHRLVATEVWKMVAGVDRGLPK